uniref:DUF3842 family protein n=1 Tax=Ndongobacter massiliensis TaxID=1871025 RepID=UPI0009305ED7|nr:DUF3842 family protein [Ndongobacter massiliensis]
MKILVVDGQGGRMGQSIIEILKSRRVDAEIIAVGTNSLATGAMLKAKPDAAATGENAILVNCRDADYIIGPIGILVADALHGEISPKIAVAVGSSAAKKILFPITRCNTMILGVPDFSLSRQLELLTEALGLD